MIDSTDQKARRGRDEMREQGAEVSKRQEVVGNKKHSVKRGGVSPRPWERVTLWVALGVENKGQVGGLRLRVQSMPLG